MDKDFLETYDRFKNLVSSAVYDRIQTEDRRDVEQEVWLTISRKFDELKTQVAPHSWIYTIAKNETFDYLRSSIALKRSPGNDNVVDMDDFFESETRLFASQNSGLKPYFASPEDRLIGHEYAVFFHRVFSKRIPSDYQIVLAQNFSGYKNEKSADLLSISVSSVHIKINKAKKRLLKALVQDNQGRELFRDQPRKNILRALPTLFTNAVNCGYLREFQDSILPPDR